MRQRARGLRNLEGKEVNQDGFVGLDQCRGGVRVAFIRYIAQQGNRTIRPGREWRRPRSGGSAVRVKALSGPEGDEQNAGLGH